MTRHQSVIPAKAGTQGYKGQRCSAPASRFRGSDKRGGIA